MITVVLTEPKTEGNIGALARVMKNFDLKNLVLIKPKCNHLGLDAKSRAKHAKDILKNASVKDFSYLKKFDYVIGTTAMLGTDYNIPRSPLTPEQLADKIYNVKGKIALLFGRDSFGLTNEEIKKCDFIVTIPTHKKYPTMNISHAASVIFYALFKKIGKENISEHIITATKKEKDIILKNINKILNKLEFQTKQKKDTQKIVWKRIIGKSLLTKREAYALLGFLRKLSK
jgi:TrmH family RNA methyltransferase